MISAWVLYYDAKGKGHFEVLTGHAHYGSTNPLDWGLAKECTICLVLQSANFIDAWLDGELQVTR